MHRQSHLHHNKAASSLRGRQSVAIAHPRIGHGGSESIVMWVAEALKGGFEVSILTTNSIDLDDLKRHYGTSLRPDEVTFRKLSVPLISGTSSAAALRGALFQRALRAVAGEYDLLISAYNPCDFGVPAIHCIADFSWDDELRRRLDPSGDGLAGAFYRDGPVRRAYLGLARMLSAPSGRNVFAGEDLIVANSIWTAGILQERHGVANAPVVYPPVTEPSVCRVGSRNLDFVCLGRISKEKRITTMIDTLARVRTRGYPVRLRIAGALDDSPYSQKIRTLAQQNRDWIIVEGPQWGSAKWKLLSECGYGIHARSAEPFGIAVAEMVKAGCITFAPAEGGPAEILDHDTLLYRGEDDAVEKICAVLSRPALQASLLEHLSRQAGKFSAENFMRELHAAVAGFLYRSGAHTKDSSQWESMGPC